MNDLLKNKLKSYSFWVSLASAMLLLMQTIGRPLGLVIDESTYMSIVNSVLGVFVVLGIVSHPAQNLLKNSTQTTDVVSDKNVENDEANDTKNSDIIAKNNAKSTENNNFVAKMDNIVVNAEGVEIDSKSNSNSCETDVDADENYNVDSDSAQRISKAKQDFISSCIN